jgi:predicted ATPase
MRESNDAVRNKGGETFQAHSQAALAASYLARSQPEKGMEAVTEALDHISRSGECWWKAEVHRLRGELYQVLDTDRTEVERCFQKALDVARSQQAKSLELRAATSLARLWQSQDKRQEAYDLLALVYGWFTEGFDTADLQEAKALLSELT